MPLSHCRACAGRSLNVVLDFGLMPPSRRFLTREMASLPEPVQPLRILRCDDCGLLQLDGDERPEPRPNEPMPAPAGKTLSLGDALCAAHDIHSFLNRLERALPNGGAATLEIPDLAAIHDRVAYDAVCHEARCYFSLTQTGELLRPHGLELFDAEPTGGSAGLLRLSVQRRGGAQPVRPAVAEIMARERAGELDRPQPWADFAQLAEQSRDLLNSEIDEWSYRGKAVVGYSSAGRGMTMLAWCGIDSLRLPYLADECLALQGLLTPGHRIPVVSPRQIERDHPAVVLLLGRDWDPDRAGPLTDHWRSGGRVLVPLPKPHYVDPPRMPAAKGRDTMAFSEFA